MRHDLKVPFAEKDQAKKQGARWDAARRLWYIEDGRDPSLFARWQPTPHDPAVAASLRAPRRSASPKAVAEGTMQVGRCVVARPRVCDCLPWDDCEKCRLQSWPLPQGGR